MTTALRKPEDPEDDESQAPPKLTLSELRAIQVEADAWIAMVLARASHGHVTIRIDLKDDRILGIRGGGEATRLRK